MANTNVLEGMRCPKCASDGPFGISVTITGVVLMTDNGYGFDDFEPWGTEWDDSSNCDCPNCGREGKVRDFREKD